MGMSWEVDYCCSLLFWSFAWLSFRSLSRWFSCSPLLQCCGKATRAWSSEISLFSVLVGPSVHSRHSLWTIRRYCAFTYCRITSQSTLFFLVSLILKHLRDGRASIDEWNGASFNPNQYCQYAMALFECHSRRLAYLIEHGLGRLVCTERRALLYSLPGSVLLLNAFKLVPLCLLRSGLILLYGNPLLSKILRRNYCALFEFCSAGFALH